MRQSVARVERRGWRAEVVPDEEITPELDEGCRGRGRLARPAAPPDRLRDDAGAPGGPGRPRWRHLRAGTRPRRAAAVLPPLRALPGWPLARSDAPGCGRAERSHRGTGGRRDRTRQEARARLRKPQLRRLRPRDGRRRSAEPQPARTAIPPSPVPRPVPARAAGPLQREVLPHLAAALPGLRRARAPATLRAAGAPGRGLSARASSARPAARGVPPIRLGQVRVGRRRGVRRSDRLDTGPRRQ